MFSIGSCKNKNPSILKVYVRSSDNVMVEVASVIVVGDQKSIPTKIEYADSSKTNASGFVEFNMQTYFDLAGEKENPFMLLRLKMVKEVKEWCVVKFI